ncbi:hypothetical protein [Nostoc sp.]
MNDYHTGTMLGVQDIRLDLVLLQCSRTSLDQESSQSANGAYGKLC